MDTNVYMGVDVSLPPKNTYIFGDKLDGNVLNEKLLRIKRNNRGRHQCSPECLSWNDHEDDDLPNHKAYANSRNPYLKPIAKNFARFAYKIIRKRSIRIWYIAPCGAVLDSLKAIQHFLLATECTDLTMINFTLSENFHLEHMEVTPIVYKADISNGTESIPVVLFNSISNDSNLHCRYIQHPFYSKKTYEEVKEIVDKVNRCRECSNICVGDHDKCVCPKEGLFYHYKRLYHFGQNTLFECTSKCKCSVHCVNKLVSLGIQCEFQIYRTARKGWAVRATHFISKGAYIFPYVGELFMEKHHPNEGDEYVAVIGRYTKDENGFLKIDRESTSEDDSILMDGINASNLACFVNHSCSPNLFVQIVVTESQGKLVPNYGFFASRDINPFEELTWDYHYNLTDSISINCNCASLACHCLLR